MALPFETVTFPFAMGMNTKMDPKAMPAPGLQKCENAIFDEAGSIQKRWGFSGFVNTNADGSGNIDRRRALGTRNDELVLFAQGKAFSWSDNDTEWQERGRFESVLVDLKQVFPDKADQRRADRAEVSDVVCYAWYSPSGLNSGVNWRCVDKSTGAVFHSASVPSDTPGTFGAPRVRVVNSKFHVYYEDGATLEVVVIDPSNVYGTINSTPIAVATNLGTSRAFDVVSKGTTAIVVWQTTTANQYSIEELNGNAANVTGPTTHNYNCSGGIGVDYEDNHDVIAVARLDTRTTDNVRHDWLNGSTLAAVTMDTSVKSETSGRVTNVSVVALQDGASYQAYVVWDVDEDGTDKRLNVVKRGVVDDAAGVTVKVVMRHAWLGSKPVLWDDGSTERTLLAVFYGHVESLQPTYFLLSLDDVIGDEGQGGNPDAGAYVGLLARFLYAQAQDTTQVSFHLPQLQSLGSDKFAMAAIDRRSLPIKGRKWQFSERGVVDAEFEFLNPIAFKGVQEGNTLYLPGGYVAAYDGEKVVESGFLMWPEIQGDEHPTQNDFAAGASGSLTENSTYSYRATWARKLANGEIQRSWASPAVNVALGSGQNDFTFSTATLGCTNDNNGVILELWRTEANPGEDAQYYLVTSLDPTSSLYIRNEVNDDLTIAITDQMPDSQLITGPVLPFSPNEVSPQGEVAHIAPPPTKYIASGQDRLFTIDPMDPDRIWFSKLRFWGEGVQFSDALFMDVPQHGGKVTALDVTDSGVLIFKERAIYYAAGQGPDNNGVSPYPTPQPISQAVGCEDPGSVVRTKNGTLFKSSKGIYRIDASLNLHFVGANIDAYNDIDTITSAVDIPDHHMAVLLGNTSGAFVYDYLIDQWSLWTGVVGESMVVFDGDVTFLHSTQVRHQDKTLYQDDGNNVTFLVETAWIRLKDLPSYHKALWYEILAEWRNTHQLKVRVAYDLDETGYTSEWTDTHTWTLPSAIETAGKRESFLMRFSQMKTPAVKFEISDTISGESDLHESFKLNHLAVKMAVIPKLGGTGTTITGSGGGTVA